MKEQKMCFGTWKEMAQNAGKHRIILSLDVHYLQKMWYNSSIKDIKLQQEVIA